MVKPVLNSTQVGSKQVDHNNVLIAQLSPDQLLSHLFISQPVIAEVRTCLFEKDTTVNRLQLVSC